MQDAEEQDTCRICSAPAEPDQPLFHPCKCSGTIRYIHQDCLTTWLAHSRKKNCDVCKYPYSFTKVYAPDMPARLPPVLLLRRLAQQSLYALIFCLRAVVVGIIWLAVLPWVTVWTWRMYFTMGDNTAWWISDRARPPPERTSSSSRYNLTDTINDSSAAIPADAPILIKLMAHPTWRMMSADIVTGQIIASLIVLTFVAVFLLREWISQNARPGVFEEDEVLPEDREAVRQVPMFAPNPPPAPAPAPAPVRALHALPPLQPQVQPNRRPPTPRHRSTARPIPREDQNAAATPQGGKARRVPAQVDGPPKKKARHTARRLHGAYRRDRGKGKDLGETAGPDVQPAAFHPGQSISTDDSQEEGISADETLSDTKSDVFQFTFKGPEIHPLLETSWDSQVTSSNSLPSDVSQGEGDIDEDDSPSRSSSYGGLSSDVQSSFELVDLNLPSNSSTSVFPNAEPQSTRRRPPLPTNTLPASDDAGPSALRSPAVSRSIAQTPLVSPSLATYRAPEELEAGPSMSGFFNQEDGVYRESLREEHDRYFEEPTEDDESVDAEDGSPRELFSPDSDEEEEYEGEYESEEEGEWEDPIQLQNEGEAEHDPEDGGEEVAQAAPEPGQDAVQVPEGGEEVDGNVEDDMEGAMEAIGMRGPIFGVAQNAALMIFVLDTAIGLGIWLPFTIGKSTALLSLDPYRFLQILHLPIRAMRIITDPIVDSVMLVLLEYITPYLLRRLRNYTFIIWFLVFPLLEFFISEDRLGGIHEYLSNIVDNLNRETLFGWLSFHSSQSVSNSSHSWEFIGFLDDDAALVRLAETYFAAIGKQVRLNSVRLQTAWTRLALGHGTTERLFAICLGYAVVGLWISLYLNILTVGNVKSAGRAVRNAVRQQLLVAKVATFIVIELVVFPLGCGIMLDLCTIWLFPEATFQSRLVFFVQAPMTAAFFHWVAGTLFMYQFAILLAGCRGIMRPGAMWFIKDPQDQNFHPIRDILDRPTLTQLRKLFVSAVMYAFVVACGVGSIASLLILGSKSILPLRWKNREPLSKVPIDLLFLQLVLPYTMHYFRPKKMLHKIALHIWKYLAHQLRLTSYMFGTRRPSEEYTSKHWSLPLLFLRSEEIEVDDPSNIHDGTFRRVPATDNVALPRDMRATAEVNEKGDPADDHARKLMDAQNLEAENAKRTITEDYCVVYVPPHFRYRIILFIFLLWVIGAIVAATFVATPIQLGRMFFKLFLPYDVHDGYSFIAGFYLLWACYLVGRVVDRMDRHRQRRSGDGPRAELPVFVIKRGLLWFAKISYMIIFMGFIIPMLTAVVLELYIILPIRFTVNPTMTPHIRIVDMWALGLLYGKIALRIHRQQPPNRVLQGLMNIVSNGWTQPNPVAATKEFIGPMGCGLVGMIVLPALLFRLVQYLFPALPIDNKFLFMHVYSGIFAITGFSQTLLLVINLLSTWAQSIRDKEFLVEMRLRNHEPEKEKAEVKVGANAKGTEVAYFDIND